MLKNKHYPLFLFYNQNIFSTFAPSKKKIKIMTDLFDIYEKGLLKGKTIEDIEREIAHEAEVERIKRIERELSTNIVKVDYLRKSLCVELPENVINEIELNNTKIDWIKEKNSKPPKHGIRPVYIKNTKIFIDDINNIYSKYVHEMMDTTTIHTLHQELQCLFNQFLLSDKYIEKVDVNI